eukprot:221754_1
MKCKFRLILYIFIGSILSSVFIFVIFDETIYMKHLDDTEQQLPEFELIVITRENSDNSYDTLGMSSINVDTNDTQNINATNTDNINQLNANDDTVLNVNNSNIDAHNMNTKKIDSMPINRNITETDCANHIQNYTKFYQFGAYCESMIFTQSKLITLIPAKTGSSVFKFGILKLLRKKYGVHNFQKGMVETICKQNIKFNSTTLPIYINYTIKYFCDFTYEKYMIIRDPLTRILSSYLDKCVEHYNSVKNKTWTHHWWHSPCSKYLYSVGIDLSYWRVRKHRFEYDKLSMSERKELSKNNTFKGFIKWILTHVTNHANMDNHYKNLYHFGDMEYFKSKWIHFDVHDMNGWDMMVHKLLNMDVSRYHIWEKIKNDLNMTTYENEVTEETNHRVGWNESGWTPLDHHATGASRKVLLYYNDTDTLEMAIKYVWQDYYVLDIKLPKWICNVIQKNINNQNDSLRQLCVDKFRSKQYLLPSCLVTM